jgi:zinc transport system substrate-binding protein
MIRWLSVLCLLPLPALADVPRVVTDVAPIHSLTAQVMGNLGQPDLLLPPGADPHDFALRPSDAGRLAESELVIWVGEGLTPWLAEPLATLAPQAALLSLLDLSGWEQLEVRDHKEDHDGDDHGHSHDHGHDHADIDPHAWLDPSVAAVWVKAIGQELGKIDPENAATYQANAAAAVQDLTALEPAIAAQLHGLSDRTYVLPHDGYQYFEARFGLTAQAAIAGIDARTPGPAQIAALRDQLAATNVVCVFSDAEIGDRWAAVITEGTTTNTANIDGVGRGLDAGPTLYSEMLARLAGQFAACLGSRR